MKDYQPVPVAAAEALAHAHDKDIVVILCYDRQHKRSHFTTFGRAAADKAAAARLSDAIAEAASMTPTVYEDFREPGQAARNKEALDHALARVAELEAELAASSRVSLYTRDHRTVLSLLAAGVFRWEPFANRTDGAGELCFKGMRYSTGLDRWGCPILTDHLRSLIEDGGR